MPGTWEETKHPRATDGKFGEGGGTGGGGGGARPARRDASTRLVQAGARRRLRPVKEAEPPPPAGPSPEATKLSAEAHAASDRAGKATRENWQQSHTEAADAHAAAMEAHPQGTDDWRKHSMAMGDHLSKSMQAPPEASISGTGDASKAGHHVAEAQKEMKLYKQALRDGDNEKAIGHLASARQHATEVDRHTPLDHASRVEGNGKFARGTPEHEAYVKIRSWSDQRHEQEMKGRARPEAGALKAAEYDDMAAKFSASITPDQKFAIKNYTDHTDRVLNPMLRATKGAPADGAMLYSGDHAPDEVHADRQKKRDARQGGDGSVKQEIEALDSAIKSFKVDRDVKVYRTMSDPGGKIAGALTPGSTFTDHGYMSTTADRSFLTEFYDNSGHSISGRPNEKNDRVDFHIQLRKGDTAAPLSQAAKEFVPWNMPTKEGETEMLLPRGSKLRVTKVVEPSGDSPRQVHLEVVHGDDDDDKRKT